MAVCIHLFIALKKEDSIETESPLHFLSLPGGAQLWPRNGPQNVTDRSKVIPPIRPEGGPKLCPTSASGGRGTFIFQKVLPPSKDDKNPSAAWTSEGTRCRADKESSRLEAGVHYEAVDGPDRILLPDLPVLETLRHRWYWKRRARPYVPVWNYAKVPRVTLSPEENARLLCVYMRPWTLNPADATEQTPLLSRLGMVRQEASPSATISSTRATENLAHTGSAQDREKAHERTASAN